MHKLALLFPETSDLPQLIWVEVRKYIEKDEHGVIYARSVGVSQGLVKHLGSFPRIDHRNSNRKQKLQMYADDMQQKLDGNQCLSHLTKGYASREVSDSSISIHDWNGHRAVVGYTKENKDGEVSEYRDVTLNDFRSIIDTISNKMNVFENDTANSFVLRDETQWIKAAKISCSGDVEFLGKEKFRQIEVRKDHPVFTSFDELSIISEHIGLPLLAKKCPFDPTWLPQARKATGFDPCENSTAWRLMYNYKSTAPFGEWGFPKYPTWDNGMDPTVLFARKDQKDLTKYQIEGLCPYVEMVVFWKLVDEGNFWSKKEKTTLIKRYLTADAFDNYFKGYCYARYQMGQKGWGNAAEDSGCGTKTYDLLRGVQGLNVDDSDE
jgi:hypothetical protein